MNPRLRKHLAALLNASGSFVMKVRLLAEDDATWTRSEIEAELRRMESAGLVVLVNNDLGELTAKLTAAGAAFCAEYKL